MSYRGVVFGFYNQRNAGDDRFAEILKRWLHDHDLFFLPHTSPPPLDLVRQCDYVLVGGGTILSGQYGVFADNFLWARREKIPVFGVGLGVHDRPGVKEVLAGVQQTGGRVWVRDAVSLELAANIRSSADLGPDLAWMYGHERSSITCQGTVAVNLRPCPWREFPESSWSAKLSELGENYEAWPLCFGREDDRETLQKILPNCTMPGEFSIHPIVRSRVALLMRYHAVIFAIQAGTPFVYLNNAKKVRLLLESIGLETPQVALEDPSDLVNIFESESFPSTELLLEIAETQRSEASLLASVYREAIEDAADQRRSRMRQRVLFPSGIRNRLRTIFKKMGSKGRLPLY